MNTLIMNMKKYISKSRNKKGNIKIQTISLEHWENIEGTGRSLSGKRDNANHYNSSLYLDQSQMIFSSKLR